VLGGLRSGWRNARLPDQQVSLSHGDRVIDVSYRSERDDTFTVNDSGRARVHRWSPTHIDVEVDSRRTVGRVTSAGALLLVQTPRGTIEFGVVPRFVLPGVEEPPGGLTAPMPGVVLNVRVAVGDVVTAGQTLVVLEAMKMEHHMDAPFDGTVSEVLVVAGQQVDNGAVLMMIEPADAGTAAGEREARG
jgi:propionyl-CoA carboxylase alpha chain